MPLAISTNIAAEKANYYLGYNADKMQESIKRLASGKKLTSPVQDPGNLAVSMKLSASLNRLAGAMNNAQNGISFLEVQDGMLETVGKIIDRMSELKGLSSQDPMKSDMDKSSYNNEFKDLQLQLYAISQEQFNGVSLFANYISESKSDQVKFGAMNQDRTEDHTISIHTSQNGSSGAKVSLHKSLLLSALTLRPKAGTVEISSKGNSTANSNESGFWTDALANNKTVKEAGNNNGVGFLTLASNQLSDTLSVDSISVGVLTTALENVAFLRAQNGGTGSRLNFSYEALSQQRTNMRAALGRMVDVDVAEESTNLSKYNVLSQAAASMIAQANSTSELALILLR
jgi:flagellin